MDDELLRDRRIQLRAARQEFFQLPGKSSFELAGRPGLLYQIIDYSNLAESGGAPVARHEIPFLFKAFETGQVPPPKPGSKRYLESRPVTIHEYLDWTVTASYPSAEDELDFSGFRIASLFPRYKPCYPAPSDGQPQEPPYTPAWPLGAPNNSLPALMVGGKAYCAAAIRQGIGYLEVPFFATADHRRNKGYGRALLEAIEEMARALRIPRILLCSTDDANTKNTWRSLGFLFTTDEDLRTFGVHSTDLLHMDNTVQMHKEVPPPRMWRSLKLKHESFVQRVWFPAEAVSAAVPTHLQQVAMDALGGAEDLPAAVAEAAIREQKKQTAKEVEMGCSHFAAVDAGPVVVPLNSDGELIYQSDQPSLPHHHHHHHPHPQTQLHHQQLQQPGVQPLLHQQQQLQAVQVPTARNGYHSEGLKWGNASGQYGNSDVAGSGLQGGGLGVGPVKLYQQPLALTYANAH